MNRNKLPLYGNFDSKRRTFIVKHRATRSKGKAVLSNSEHSEVHFYATWYRKANWLTIVYNEKLYSNIVHVIYKMHSLDSCFFCLLILLNRIDKVHFFVTWCDSRFLKGHRKLQKILLRIWMRGRNDVYDLTAPSKIRKSV